MRNKVYLIKFVYKIKSILGEHKFVNQKINRRIKGLCVKSNITIPRMAGSVLNFVFKNRKNK